MRGGSVTVTRTKSLPARGGKSCRKVKPKVSFSSLPPSKIEFECEYDPSETYASKETLFNARIALFQAEKSGNQVREDEDILATPSEHPEPANDLDSVNEMLLDIIEEIEAENVTIEDCLRDAISLKILDVKDAKEVIPNFEIMKITLLQDDLNNNNSTQTEQLVFDSSLEEKPIDKLIDLFSTLKTEDLARCCKFTLGKLCQLTSYEDYENVQRIAASSKSVVGSSEGDFNMSNIDENSTISSGFSDDCSIDTSCLSSSSTDSMDFSSIDSDIDFVKNFRQVENESFHTRHDLVQDVIPSLIDNRILKPREAWKILSSRNRDEMLARLMNQISMSCGTKAFRNTVENVSSSTSLHLQPGTLELSADLGYCSPGDENRLSPVVRSRSFHVREQVPGKLHGRFSVNKPFTISSARSKQRESRRRTSSPHASNKHPQDQVSLRSWCLENDLPSSTVQALQTRGCDTMEDLLSLEPSDLQQLPDVSRGTKSRLWVAIETLRLQQNYFECKRKLDHCAKAFKSMS